jgi:hypothetical protein
LQRAVQKLQRTSDANPGEAIRQVDERTSFDFEQPILRSARDQRFKGLNASDVEWGEMGRGEPLERIRLKKDSLRLRNSTHQAQGALEQELGLTMSEAALRDFRCDPQVFDGATRIQAFLEMLC